MRKKQFMKKVSKIKQKGIIILFFILFACSSWLYADGGLIPYYSTYNVYEPGQTALIGWNGTAEVMILSTDVSLTGSGWVIELIPFPSLPGPGSACPAQSRWQRGKADKSPCRTMP